jgi:hypothetical protein
MSSRQAGSAGLGAIVAIAAYGSGAIVASLVGGDLPVPNG